MEHEDLHQRLRSLGEQPVPGPVASNHLASLAATGSRAAWTTRRFSAAAVAVGLIAAGGVAAAAATTSGPPPRVEIPVAAPFETADDPDGDVDVDDDERTDDERTDDDTRTEPPGIERARAAHARSAENGETDETDDTDVRERPHADDPCAGPPPFAGVFPHADGFAPGERGIQARLFAQFRAEHCAADDGTDETDETIETADDGERRGPPAHAAAPAHGDRGAGSSAPRPVGPPADRPVSPDAPRPVGPPSDRPGHRVGPANEDRPSGPPSDRPAESADESDDE